MFISTGTADHPLDHRFRREPGFAYWTLGACPEGAVTFEIRDARCVLKSPCLLLVPPNTPYAIAYAGDTHRGARWHETWVIFSPPAHWHDLLSWPVLIPGLMSIPAADGAGAVAFAQCEDVHRIASGPLPQRERFAENALEHGLLLARLAHAGSGPAMHAGVRATRDYLAGAPAGKITIAGLARRARMSPSLLAHRFTEQVGETPMRFLEQCRIDQAKRLLIASNLSIGEVASACGFDDAFHFSTRFRRLVGRPPRAYRQDPSA